MSIYPRNPLYIYPYGRVTIMYPYQAGDSVNYRNVGKQL